MPTPLWVYLLVQLAFRLRRLVDHSTGHPLFTPTY